MAIATRKLTTADAARILGLSEDTLITWRCRGLGPRYLKLGRSVRYDEADLAAYIDASRRSQTDEGRTDA